MVVARALPADLNGSKGHRFHFPALCAGGGAQLQLHFKPSWHLGRCRDPGWLRPRPHQVRSACCRLQCSGVVTIHIIYKELCKLVLCLCCAAAWPVPSAAAAAVLAVLCPPLFLMSATQVAVMACLLRLQGNQFHQQ